MAPATVGQILSLWAIHAALASLALVISIELYGVRRSYPPLATLWCCGAIFAILHSLGALWTFHHGSQTEAYLDTANQTKALLGFAFGAGLFVNYVFLLVWLIDVCWAVAFPRRFEAMPFWYHAAVLGFLAFIAFNGTVVFKTGWIRWAGLGTFAVWVVLAVQSLRNRNPAIESQKP